MAMYNEKVMDLFMNPKNVGEVENYDYRTLSFAIFSFVFANSTNLSPNTFVVLYSKNY